MGRSILAVFAGAVLWALLWASTNAGLMAAFPEIIQPDEYVGHLGMLLTFLGVSFIYSVAAGYITALVAKSKAIQHGLALGILQLSLGIFIEVSYWELLPVWYHLVFLVLLIPGNVTGAAIRADRPL